MNSARRARLSRIIEDINAAVSKLGDTRDEEQAYLDEMPENFQDSNNAEVSREAIEAMEVVIDGINGGISTLEELL